MTRKLVKERVPVLTTTFKYYVVFDHELFELAKYFVDQLGTVEGQWYSTLVADYSERAAGKIIYNISDMFIPDQTVTTTTVSSEPLQIATMWQEVKKERGLDPKDLTSLMANAGAWCHSHVNMEAKPTGTDEEQWQALIGRAQSPKAMLIFNQKGDIYCRIYDPNLDGLIIEGPPCAIVNTFNYSKIDDAIAKQVTQKKVVQVVSSSTGGTAGAPLGHTTGSTGTSGTKTTTETEFIFHYTGKH